MADRTCDVPGCESKHEARGFCPRHYKNFMKHGTVEAPRMKDRSCSVDGCERNARTRGWCSMHYKRWAHRGGDPAEHMHERPLDERLMRRLVPSEGGCLEWTGARHPTGYGQIGVTTGVLAYTHRVAWEFAFRREVPDGMWVLHHCDNPPCCNPDHLFLGTPMDNTRDMIRKGRAAWQQRRTA